VICYARAEVALTMRSDAYDPWVAATMSAGFPCLVEEVNAVTRKKV